jgi:hypothetical protein
MTSPLLDAWDDTPAEAPDYVKWSVDLAQPTLAERIGFVQRETAQLRNVPAQIQTLAQQPPTPSESVSFSAGEAPSPAAEFWGLYHANAHTAVTSPDEVSFAVSESEEKAQFWQAFEIFQREAEKTLRIVQHLAWIETKVEGQLIGHTIMSWGSDTRTVWSRRASAQFIAQHCQSINAALDARYAFLRRLELVMQGAQLITAASTGQWWAAAPLLWKFVSRLVDEVQDAPAQA